MKKISLILFVFIMTVALSGCMYPDKEKVENQVPDEAQLLTVQKAVDQFRKDTGGLLPIQNRDQNVDRYIKYPINFEKLTQGYIAKTPGNAFEKGGIYQYVIWNAESENPEVKLVDLRGSETIRELNIKKGVNGFVPISRQIKDDVYEFDYKKMGYKKAPTVPSPYSNTNLPLVVKGSGEICIDYSIELQKIINESKVKVKPGEDIRYLLSDKYPILPAYSLPYTVNEKNEVEFLTKSNKK
ncbi:hypothetical protein CW357_16960 [Rummeliibacillus sp. TYF005]|uniref:hypothetical protein n=1 Tax=Rummeliibacillus sp. TYF005 TaxID=2058214 RepID=UPI000F545E3D|nr:hypothetical protein [Rummeliibacillus sp. TYF005]RPJ94137.1 hypothetical protein CW357_16960 [Rummeliibacillus sp. TYF005]